MVLNKVNVLKVAASDDLVIEKNCDRKMLDHARWVRNQWQSPQRGNTQTRDGAWLRP
jgi:hypothetical protein